MSVTMAYIKNRKLLILFLNIITILRPDKIEIAWAEFTPVAAFGSGAMIGVAALFLMLLNGRIMGMSGILSGLLVKLPDWPWQLTIIIRVMVGPFIIMALACVPIERQTVMSGPFVNIAAFRVGLGTAVG